MTPHQQIPHTATSRSGNYLAVLLDSPAVFRIISAVQGKLICHICAPDGSDIVSPPYGKFPPFKTTGSGAFVSPDGYILTTDHVVDSVSSIKEQAIQDIAQRYNMQQADVSTLVQQHQNQLKIDIQTSSQKVFLTIAYTGSLQTTEQIISYPVTRIVAYSPIDQQDVAIIKVEAQDMPHLTLPLDSQVNVGEQITALAFPAHLGGSSNNGPEDVISCLFNLSTCDLDTISNLLTPVQQQGQIIAKTNDGAAGFVYETSPIGSPGSSGGSVIDEQGRMIGFVYKGSESENVLVSRQVARGYVNQAGITNADHGAFEAAWTKAKTEYEATGSYQFPNAAKDLQTLSEHYPHFGAVLPTLQDAQSRAANISCPSPFWPLSAVIGGGIVFIVLMTLAVLLMWRRRRGRPLPVMTETE